MASYTRLIEFKVKDTELNRAVNKLSKTLDRIDKSLVGIDKKLDHIARQGFGLVAKEANKAEKSVGKLAKSMKSMSGPQGFARMVTGAALGGILGKKGDIADAVVRIGALDGAIRLLTKGNTGLPALQRRIVDATTAIGGFTIANAGAIAGITAGSAAILTGTKFFYDFGRSVRQAEANLIDFIRTEKESGRSIGQTLKSLMPKWKSGSRLGGADSGGPNIGLPPSSPIGVGSSRGLEVVRPKLIQSQIAGVTKLNRELARSQEIQDNINASIRGPYKTAVVAVKQAQFAYNLELQKARVIQAAVNADIWLAQKAWQGVIGTLKGATGLVGSLFGGKFGGIGQAAGVIGLSRGIEELTGKLGFLNKAWIENINKVALWSTRAAEAIASINIAYGVLSTGLNAASWTVGAIKGFVDFEKQAVLSLNKINAARINLDKKMSSWLSRNKPGFGKKGGSIGPTQNKAGFLETMFGPIGLMMGDRMSGELQGIYGGASKFKDRSPLMKRQEEALAKAREELSKLHTTSKGFEAQLRKVVKLEEKMNKEIAKREGLYKKISPTEIAKKEKAQIEAANKAREDGIRRGRALRDQADKKIKAAAEERFKEIQRRWKLEAQNHRKEVQRIKERNRLERQKRTNRRNARARFGENLMLGAGFPLLFGGGPGAVLGGVTGAAAQSAMGSKGFGAQILFSAIGQQVDAFVAKIATLGKAFNVLNPDVDAVIGALGETNTVYGKHLEMLKKIKGEEAAMREATKAVEKIIGKRGLGKMKEFGQDVTDLGNEWQKVMLRMQASIAALITRTGILKALSESMAKGTAFQRANLAVITGTASPELQKLWDAYDKQNTISGSAENLRQNLITRPLNKDGSFKFPTQRELKPMIIEQFLKDQQKTPSNFLLGPDADKTIDFEKKKKISDADLFDLNEKIKLERERLNLKEGQFEIESRQIEINRQVLEISWAKSRLDELEKENLTKEEELEKKNLEIKIKKLTAEKDLSQAQLDNLKILNDVNEKYRQIGDTIKDGIVDAIESAVEGTKTLGEVASQVLRAIAKQLLTAGVGSFFDTVGSKNKGNFLGKIFGGGKAKGGPVSGGTSYLVGEKGPELFTPKSSGHITANDALGGSVINVSVDASGSSAEGDADKGRELGRMLGAAIQAELLKQQRPGGILSR